jgi:hypothetical protein
MNRLPFIHYSGLGNWNGDSQKPLTKKDKRFFTIYLLVMVGLFGFLTYLSLMH